MKRVIVLGLAIFLAASAFADMPRVMNYQGKITYHTGVGVDSTLDMVFSIYDVATAGTPLWSELHRSVSVAHGMFDVLLGDDVPFPDSLDFSDPYWLEVEIGTETLVPRHRLYGAAYSMRAAVADSVVGIALITFIDSVTFIDSITFIDSVTYIDSISYIDSVSYIDSIGFIDHVNAADSVSHRLSAGDGLTGADYNGFVDRTWEANVDNSSISINGSGEIEVKTGGITNSHIADETIRSYKLSPFGGGEGKVLKILSGVVQWADDDTGSGGGSGSGDNDWEWSSGSGLTGDIYHTGNVGIGTTSPGYKLEVNGTFQADNVRSGTFDLPTADGSSGQFLSYNGTWATPSGGVGGSGTDNYLARWDGTTNLQGSSVYVTDGGNVGIGTTSPDASLELQRDVSGVYEALRVNNTNGLAATSARISFQYFSTDRTAYIESKPEFTGSVWSPGLAFGTGYPTPAERMRITYNGNVGIGTTSPGYKLEVNGTFQADNVRSGTFDLPTADGSSGQFLSYNGTWATPSGGGTGTPGGADGNVQYNGAGAFAGEAAFNWDAANDELDLGNPGRSGSTINVENSSGGSAVRILGDGSFDSGGRLNFGDGNYVYIEEDADDDMLIHVYDLALEVKGTKGSAGQVLTSDGTHVSWQDGGGVDPNDYIQNQTAATQTAAFRIEGKSYYGSTTPTYAANLNIYPGTHTSDRYQLFVSNLYGSATGGSAWTWGNCYASISANNEVDATYHSGLLGMAWRSAANTAGVVGSYNGTGRFGALAYYDASSNPTAVYGQYDSNHYGYIGRSNYAIYAYSSSTTGAETGTYGRRVGQDSGDLSSDYGIRGTNTNSGQGGGCFYSRAGVGADSPSGNYGDDYDYQFGCEGEQVSSGPRFSGGVIGAYLSSRFGALAYTRTGGSTYGLFYNGGSGSGSGRRRPESGDNIVKDIGAGGRGGLFGHQTRGDIYGQHVIGERYGQYVDGENYTNRNYAVLTDDGTGQRVATYATTSPTVDVYAHGRANLVSGSARVEFSDDYKRAISGDVPVTVTVTPMGSCNGVYLSEVDENGFTVVENNGGSSDIAFSFIAIGRRAGYEDNPTVPEEILTTDYDDIMRDFTKYEADRSEKIAVWFDKSTGSFEHGQLPDTRDDYWKLYNNCVPGNGLYDDLVRRSREGMLDGAPLTMEEVMTIPNNAQLLEDMEKARIEGEKWRANAEKYEQAIENNTHVKSTSDGTAVSKIKKAPSSEIRTEQRDNKEKKN